MPAAPTQHGMIIPTKPSVPIMYSFVESAQQLQGSKTLVIFCSGLCDPMSVWFPTLAAVAKKRKQKPRPPMLLYDRFGSGATGPDPTDKGKGAQYTHDVMDSVRDLRELLIFIVQRHLAIPPSEIDALRLVFVAHSMGAIIAELYAKRYPKTVAALLVLDGAPTNSDGQRWYSDPDSLNFSPAALPEGVTPELLRMARKQQRASVYNPNSVNGEQLRWSNLSDYIPNVGAPKLRGPINGTPLLTVMAHDPVPFAKQVKKLTGADEITTQNYNSPSWFQYLEEFSNLVDPNLRKGPIITKGSGHFIHLERPDLVALELNELLDRLFSLCEMIPGKL